MPARSRLLAPCLAVLLGATLASCSEDPEVTGADPAALPEDLCAALAEEVPSDLGLDGGSPSHAVDDELVRSRIARRRAGRHGSRRRHGRRLDL